MIRFLTLMTAFMASSAALIFALGTFPIDTPRDTNQVSRSDISLNLQPAVVALAPEEIATRPIARPAPEPQVAAAPQPAAPRQQALVLPVLRPVARPEAQPVRAVATPVPAPAPAPAIPKPVVAAAAPAPAVTPPAPITAAGAAAALGAAATDTQDKKPLNDVMLDLSRGIMDEIRKPVATPAPKPEVVATPAPQEPETTTTLTGANAAIQAALALSAPKRAAPQVPQPAQTGTFYTVQAGDSLAGISFRFFGTTTGTYKILEANTDVIQGFGQLKQGMVLRIPDA